jgi:hypothetical protein
MAPQPISRFKKLFTPSNLPLENEGLGVGRPKRRTCACGPEKLWMPAFAGMTGEGEGGNSNPIILGFSRIEYNRSFLVLFSKKNGFAKTKKEAFDVGSEVFFTA